MGHTEGKISTELITIFLTNYISEGAIDMNPMPLVCFAAIR